MLIDTPVREEAESDAKKEPPHNTDRRTALLCGLHAVNALLKLHNKPQLERKEIDSINEAISAEEARIRADRRAVDTHPQAEGNYALDLLAATIKKYAGIEFQKATINGDGTPQKGTYLAGNGNHWQVIHALPKGRWSLYDNSVAYPLRDVAKFARKRLEKGVLLQVQPSKSTRTTPTTMTDPMQTDDGKANAAGTPPLPDADTSSAERSRSKFRWYAR